MDWSDGMLKAVDCRSEDFSKRGKSKGSLGLNQPVGIEYLPSYLWRLEIKIVYLRSSASQWTGDINWLETSGWPSPLVRQVSNSGTLVLEKIRVCLDLQHPFKMHHEIPSVTGHLQCDWPHINCYRSAGHTLNYWGWCVKWDMLNILRLLFLIV